MGMLCCQLYSVQYVNCVCMSAVWYVHTVRASDGWQHSWSMSPLLFAQCHNLFWESARVILRYGRHSWPMSVLNNIWYIFGAFYFHKLCHVCKGNTRGYWAVIDGRADLWSLPFIPCVLSVTLQTPLTVCALKALLIQDIYQIFVCKFYFYVSSVMCVHC